MVVISQQLFSQFQNRDSINYSKLLVLSGLSAGTFTYAYGIQNNMWWKGEKSRFHTNWAQDWNASLGADKIGHFYFGYSVATIYKHGLGWSGFSQENSVLYSGLLAFSYQTFLEIRDGYSKDYGFSWGDFGANLFGSMYPYLQNKYPILEHFKIKVSYDPSNRFTNNSHEYILDDYESTYHWLSIDIEKFLPSSVAKVLPDIVNFSIGHSVKGLSTQGKRNHEVFVGLDWDIEAIPWDSPILSFLKETLNLYHLPAPTIKIYPNIVWYGLKL